MMAFDPKCYELAECFLPDAAIPRLKDELAQQIQDAIETFLQIERDHREYEHYPDEEYPDNGPSDPWQTSGPGRAA